MQSKCLKFAHSLTLYVRVQSYIQSWGGKNGNSAPGKKDNKITYQTLTGVAQDQTKM